MARRDEAAPIPPDEDPVLRSLREAPVDDEPETDEERIAVEEARADVVAGRLHSLSDVAADIDIDLDRDP